MGQYGFTNCYNVLEGFEGEKDEIGHRGLKTDGKLLVCRGFKDD